MDGNSSGATAMPQGHANHYIHSPMHSNFIPFNSIVIIVVLIILFLLILAVFLIVVMLRRLKSVRKSGCCNESNGGIHTTTTSCSFVARTGIDFNSSPDVKANCLYGGSMRKPGLIRYRGVQVFTYKELESATDNFSEANVIGNGGSSVVYKGVLVDGTVAAVKRLRRDRKQGERAFRMEVDLLSRLNSPYLVELLGYCADQQHRLLIFEFMPNGTLQQHLHHPGSEYRPLDWGSRLRIALDCARALEFLHEHSNPTVIHRDFKCTNVLLDQHLRAKVSDFGLAKMGSDKINSQISTHIPRSTGYIAPELQSFSYTPYPWSIWRMTLQTLMNLQICSTGKLTTKSDVYSYGIVLLQLLTGRVPVDIKRPPGEHVLVSWALPRLTNRDKVEEMVDPDIQGQYSKKDLIQVSAIAAMCVQPEADYRPLMVDVVQSLVPLVKNIHSVNSPGFSRFNRRSTNMFGNCRGR